jgi:hypothetical protein
MTDMKYVRLFAGSDGESHFEDVAVEFISQPGLRFPLSEWQPVEQIRFLQYPTGMPPVMHTAPGRLFHILLTGSWTMQTSDGETRNFHPGDIVLVEDTTGKGHMTWAEGEDAVLIARIQLPG